ncbi:S-adenosyl-L-methionine-dependent methyltransferase [Flagelloscypha sp. PMI_526]|nr:S-adenosyl-L-methionine-dependent methyltransferase [Flagelloscypha sp. PMI_526]
MSTLSDLEPPLKKRRVEEDVVVSEPMDLDATLPSIGPSIEATQANKSSKRKGRGKGKVFPREIYGEDGVRWKEIVSIVGEDYVEKISQQGKDWDIPEYLKITEEHEGGIREVDVKVVKLAFNGQALSIPINSTGLPGDNNEPKWVVAHSFALPGETCRVAVHHTKNSRLHSDARLLQVLSSPAKTAIGDPVPSQTILTVDPKYHRDESQIRCPHFMTCGGCQFQYLPYPSQLAIKRDELVQAYSNFYSLSQKLSSSAPIERISAEALLKQMGKPALDGRRKKLIPPPPETSSSKNRNVKGWNPTSEDVESSLCSSYLDGKDNYEKNYVEELEQLSIQTDEAGNELHNGPKPSWMKIGFTSVRNHNLDIEECPLATQLMNETYKVARKEIARTFYSYQNGATLIYRDGLDPSPVIRQITVGLEEPKSLPGSEGPISAPPSPKVFSKDLVLEPACVSSPTARMREKVGDYFFEYSASSFFQCNHIILEDLVEYVRAAIFSTVERTENLTHLVDTYCGAGLFAICLYPHFKSVVGIELTEESIYFAKHNAWLNGMDRGRIRFQAGDASDIFAGIRKQWAPSMTKVATKQASKAQLLREEHYPGILREPRATGSSCAGVLTRHSPL